MGKGLLYVYQCGDRVLYSGHGICRIVNLEVRVLNRKRVEYYVLEPTEQPGTRFYVPTQNPTAAAKIKTILTKEELLALLKSQQIRQDVWIEDENRRKQCYRELISGGDRAAILSMIHALHSYRQAQQELGKKLHLCDEGFLRDAQKLLSSEFSLVLQIPPEEVGDYIRKVFAQA